MGNTYDDISDYQAEGGVISTLIYHPTFILYTNYLKPIHFNDLINQYYYRAIQYLVQHNVKTISALNIESAWNAIGISQEIKDKTIPEIPKFISLAVNSKRDTVDEYKMLAERVVSLAFKRNFYKESQRWQSYCTDDKMSLIEMDNKVFSSLNRLTTEFATGGEVETIGSSIEALVSNAKARKERGESYGLKSFFPSIDRYFQYERGELVLISARMKQGKSWIALIEGVHKAKSGVATLIIDTEMNDELYQYRLLSYLSGIPHRRIKQWDLSPDEEKEVAKAIKEIKALPLYHLYKPDITNEEIYTIVAQKQLECNLGFFIFDYIKYSDKMVDAGQISADMGNRCNYLKNNIAGELNIPVLAFCQLNRNFDIANSDKLEQICSTSVYFTQKTPEEIQRDGINCGTNKFFIKYNRIGDVFMTDPDIEYIDLKWLRPGVGIVEAEQHKADNPYGYDNKG